MSISIYIYVCIYVMDIFFSYIYVCVYIHIFKRESLDSDNANFSLPIKYYFYLRKCYGFLSGLIL